MTDAATVLTLEDVTLTYEGPPVVTALRGVDLEIRRGEYLAVVGPSGAGKSSLLSVMGLLTAATTGRVLIGGQDVGSAGDHFLTACRRRRIGFVFQAFHLLEGRSALENVMLPLRIAGAPDQWAYQRAEAVLDEVGISHLSLAAARNLSGGERQRVAIARALVSDPDVLLCDEPTGNLDSVNTERLLELLSRLHRNGRTLVVITHDPEVSKVADRVVRVVDGAVVSDVGKPPATSTAGTAPCRPSDSSVIRRSVRRWIQILDDALAGILERSTRTMLTSIGTVLGVAALVAIAGLGSTASGQVSHRFDRLAATTVEVSAGMTVAYEPARVARVRALNGVRGAASVWHVDRAEVNAGPSLYSDDLAIESLPVVALDVEAWEVIEPTIAWGRTFDVGVNDQNVAVLGASAARRLGVTGPRGTQSVTISGAPYVILGVIEDVHRRADLLTAVMIPDRTARKWWGDPPLNGHSQVLVETAPGAGPQVAAELPYALAPESPNEVVAIPPPDPRELRSAVSVDLSALFLVLAAVTLFVGLVGIANTSLISVMERRAEIGLRRALGEERADIRRLFVTEAALVGAAGGVVGTVLGLLALIAVCVVQEWTPAIDRWVVWGAPLSGMLSGILAGWLPARRAARIDPNSALRS